MMPYQTPDTKSENAFAKIIAARMDDIPKAQILTRFAADDIALPNIAAVAETAEPQGAGLESITGNWTLQMKITLQSDFRRTGAAEHDRMVGVLGDLLIADRLEDDLNAAMADEEFHAMRWTPGPRTNRVENGRLITEQAGELLMMPSKPAV